jgi:hypothetical protein
MAAGGTAALLAIGSAPPAGAQVWYPPVYAAPDASVKFDVKPKTAMVYVDGFYAGIVDDFDGAFQRLYTAPGPHEITLFLQGYKTYTQRAYLATDHTFKVKYQMEKLGAGEVSDPPPAPTRPPEAQAPLGPGGPNSRRQPPPQNAPRTGAPTSSAADHGTGRGTLELTLQPPDADVLIDGQSWQRTGADRVTMDLAEGEHNVQVQKPGYVGYLTDVDIHPGETTTLNVNLRAQPPK